MGRIVSQVVVENALDLQKRIELSALVDTGASYLTLPLAWRDRLGEFPKNETIDIELADQSVQQALVCGPVKIQIDQFNEFYGEVLFVDMTSIDEHYEPLLGYLPLEASRVAVDRLGHRLVPVKHADLK